MGVVGQGINDFEEGREEISVEPLTATGLALPLVERTKIGHAYAVPPCICMGVVGQGINDFKEVRKRGTLHRYGVSVATCRAHKAPLHYVRHDWANAEGDLRLEWCLKNKATQIQWI